MITLARYDEKMVYLVEQLSKLKLNLIERAEYYNKGGQDFRHSGEFERLFSQLVIVKKKLADLQNDLQAELELITL